MISVSIVHNCKTTDRRNKLLHHEVGVPVGSATTIRLVAESSPSRYKNKKCQADQPLLQASRLVKLRLLSRTLKSPELRDTSQRALYSIEYTTVIWLISVYLFINKFYLNTKVEAIDDAHDVA